MIALTRESASEQAPLAVDEYLIRHWCETLEDGNPLYLDRDYARSRGFDHLVAPPGSVMTTFAMAFRWPWPPTEHEPARHIHYEIKELLDLPVGIINEIEIETGVPLQVGDRVSVSQRLVSISPWKKTRVGEGHFWTMDRLYRNQHEELVVRERMSAFGYGRTATPVAASGSGGGWSPAVEEMIAGERTGYRPPVPRELCYEDVTEGDELPPLVMPITFTRCHIWRRRRTTSRRSLSHSLRALRKDVFVNTPSTRGLISRFLTDGTDERGPSHPDAAGRHRGDDLDARLMRHATRPPLATSSRSLGRSASLLACTRRVVTHSRIDWWVAARRARLLRSRPSWGSRGSSRFSNLRESP